MIVDKIDVKDSLSIKLIPHRSEGKKNEFETKSEPSLPPNETVPPRSEKGCGKSDR